MADDFSEGRAAIVDADGYYGVIDGNGVLARFNYLVGVFPITEPFYNNLN